MKSSKITTELMFDWEEFSKEEIIALCKNLDRKNIRWLGINHPDNRMRKMFYELTGVKIGKDTVINQNCIFSDNYSNLVEIGARCAISPNVNFIAVSEPNNSLLNDNDYVKKHLIKSQKIVVGDDVWIGTNVTILPGVKIGNGAIIGANSVVTKNIPSYVTAAGCPAKILKRIK